MTVRRFGLGACICALLLSAGEAVATEATDTPVPQHTFASDTLRYTTPAEKHYLRAGLEQLGILGIGSLLYFYNLDANSVDWDLGYDWPSFRQKLDGSAYALDTNHFETNFLSHPTAGTLYYLAARGNRLSPLESLGYTIGSSTLWEFVGEFRERVSVNDMIVTPLSGFVLGETLTQIGSFFDRSCDTTGNRLLGSLFGPSKSLHDALDGENLKRDTYCDVHGFTRSGSHRLSFSAGPSAVWQLQGIHERAFLEVRESLTLAVENLPSLGLPGKHFRGFSDGNVAQLDVSVAGGAFGWTEARVRAKVIPAGVHYRNIAGIGRKARSGEEVIFGLLVGVEHSSHRYDRVESDADQIFVLDAPAASVSLRWHRGEEQLELALDAGGAFAGVDAFALDNYKRTAALETLPSVAIARGYNYAFGAMLTPRVRLQTRELEATLVARADRFWAIRALDRLRETSSDVNIVEGRREVTARLDYRPWGLPFGLYGAVEGKQRFGTMATVRTSRSELALGGGLVGAL